MAPYTLNDIHGDVPKETATILVNALNEAFNKGYSEGAIAPRNTGSEVVVQYRMGESSAVVSEVLNFINPLHMNGLDIGSGGSPIFPQTMSMDFNRGFLGSLIQVHGDAKDLSLFNDCSLDYVFSSHCWEDFTEEEKPTVLSEWVRTIKTNGFLMLLLPDEKRYRASCANNGTGSNPNHKDLDFSMDKTRIIIQSNEYLKAHLTEIHNVPEVGGYSFFMVFKKS